MTLTEAKNKFRLAKKLGLNRFKGFWDRTYNFGNDLYGQIQFTDYEILYATDLPGLLRHCYERLENEAFSKHKEITWKPLYDVTGLLKAQYPDRNFTSIDSSDIKVKLFLATKL